MRPSRGATFTASGSFSAGIFQSTRPMRGATGWRPTKSDLVAISIHAPHAERDFCISSIQAITPYFNPCAPCGARPLGAEVKRDDRGISIHAPHAGRDVRCLWKLFAITVFQSTRPMRGATNAGDVVPFFLDISIHAPHAGRDAPQRRWRSARRYFNPRAPCGARRTHVAALQQEIEFQSTRPVRGATHSRKTAAEMSKFQSTRPVRGATQLIGKTAAAYTISIHAPRAGRDWVSFWRLRRLFLNFNPRAPCGARRRPPCRPPGSQYFNPRAPCGARLFPFFFGISL